MREWRSLRLPSLQSHAITAHADLTVEPQGLNTGLISPILTGQGTGDGGWGGGGRGLL